MTTYLWGGALALGDLVPDGIRRVTRSAATIPANTTTLTVATTTLTVANLR